jgi:hypothetical protein
MKEVYSFRIDLNMRQKLQQLADETYHSPAQVLRYLIDLAIQNPHLISPEIDITSIDTKAVARKFANGEDQEGEI